MRLNKYTQNGGKKTIIIISDREEQYSLTAALLRRDGYELLFRNRLTNVDEIKDDRPHLIICELAAPDIDGPAICRLVRDELSRENTCMLLVGDLPDRSTIVIGSLKCGATTYLQKPVDPLELADVCVEILESHEDTAHDEVGDHPFDYFSELNLREMYEIDHVDAISRISKFELREDLISTC